MRDSARRVRALVALNCALLGALALTTFGPAAQGQRSESERRRGHYAMVDGEVQGLAASGIFIVDARNRELIALSWDQSRKVLETIGRREFPRRARG